jgi:tetratricopeptide (TPR) repeat protein
VTIGISTRRRRTKNSTSEEGPLRSIPRGWSLRRAIWLLALVGAAALAPRWWHVVTHPVVVPATSAAAAREALPRALARVHARPDSVDARLELVALYSLLGDRLGAWQQLCLSEELGGALDVEALGQWEDAAAAAERARAADAGDLRRGLEAYRLLTLAGEFSRALVAAQAALAQHSDDPSAMAARGEAYFNLARYPEAIPCLQQAYSAAQQPAMGTRLGLALIRAERGHEAVSVLQEVVRSPVPPAQAWEFLGQAQLSVGRAAAAGESFSRAEMAGSLGGGAAFGAALVALAGGRASDAGAALNRALARDPQHSAAAETLAQLLHSQGRRAEAAAVRGRAALAVGAPSEAASWFRQAAVAEPRSPTRWRELARALQAAEDAPGALSALRRAQSLTPRDADLARQQIETALAVFSPQEALRACDRYASLRPTATAQYEWWRFRAYRQMQDVPRAEGALGEAAAARPDQPEFQVWQARTLLEEEPDPSRLAAAEPLLRRALAARPDNLEALPALAEVCVRERRWEEAGALLRRALSLDAEAGPGPLWLQLAQADRAMGRLREADWDIRQYREASARKAAMLRLRAAAMAHPTDGALRAAWSRASLRAGRLVEARAAARSAIRLAPERPDGYLALAVACQRLGRLEDRIVAMEAARNARQSP